MTWTSTYGHRESRDCVSRTNTKHGKNRVTPVNKALIEISILFSICSAVINRAADSDRAREEAMRQMACKPGSVPRPVLANETDRWPFLWGRHCCLPLATDPDGYPETGYVPSLFGLAPGGACQAVSVARAAVRSYRTISTLPDL